MASILQTVFWTFVVPLGGARALRGLGIAALLVLAVALLGHQLGYLTARGAETLRHFVAVPGVPVAAALLSEIALRDGITQRTLLYPLLGPVGRRTLAVGRTLLAGLLLAVAATVLALLLQALGARGVENLPREIAAIALGSLAYTALFGALHLITHRGLVTALAIYGIFDDPIGRLPFSLRVFAPSYHLRSVADLQQPFNLLLSVDAWSISGPVSAIVLAGLAAVGLAAGAVLFERKSLGDLA